MLVPPYVPGGFPPNISIPQYVGLDTAEVLVGAVSKNPDTAVMISVKACSAPPKVNVEVA